MGRSPSDTIRAVPSLARRMARSPGRIETQALVIDELTRRITALEQQVEHLHSRLEGADPRETHEVVRAVQSAVGELSIQVAEHLNSASLPAPTVTSEV